MSASSSVRTNSNDGPRDVRLDPRYATPPGRCPSSSAARSLLPSSGVGKENAIALTRYLVCKDSFMKAGTRHSAETVAKISEGVKARRGYHDAAQAARLLLFTRDLPADDRLLLHAVREAQRLAPDDAHRRHWQRFLDALEAGRKIRISSFPVSFSFPPVTKWAESVTTTSRATG